MLCVLGLHRLVVTRTPSYPRASLASAVLFALGAVSPAIAQDAAPTAPGSAASAPAVRLPPIPVRGTRLIDIGPLPGLAITKDQVPANLQSGTKEEIKRSRALNLGDYMNGRLQGVSVNDYAGNPFQLDVNYRGFTASPQVGTPQGLSVFFDGVRVNEPFGDVVNWDLLPNNAIERFDLFPGSNPVFGLNTLGGAISVRSKSGFTSPGIDASLLGGSFGRKQLQVAGGTSGALGENTWAGFGAFTLFKEDGWRDNSPSRLGQLFARGDLSLPAGMVTATVLGASNDLIGNGLIPFEIYNRRAESVFTSPDQTKNKLLQFTLSGAFDVSPSLNVTGKLFRRKSDRKSLNGDIWEDFQELGRTDVVTDWQRVNPTRPICRFADRGDGTIDGNAPLNGPIGVNCDFVGYAPSPDAGRQRNGGALSNTGAQQSGVVNAGTPIGLMTRTELGQVTDGAGVQFNWNLDRHKVMLGVSLDRSRADYLMSQRLGLIDATHRVYLAPGEIAPQFVAAFTDIVGNSFDGTQKTGSLYFSELWSPSTTLHLTATGRYNHTTVKSNVGTRSRAFSEVGDVQGSLPGYIICPSSDPSSCPNAPVAVVSATSVQQTPAVESFTYKSFNPSVGFNWLPLPGLNTYGNVSRGARVPSVVELGCALDLTLTPYVPGHPELGSAPRSLLGATCSLPTTLSGDPYLPQIRSTSGELGLRGKGGAGWEWNASAFRTDLKDDIYFVGVGAGRSYFDTIGKTRRQGLEMGIKGSSGTFDMSVNYSFVDATFQSTFYMLSASNSSADFDQNSRTILGDGFLLLGTNTTLLPSGTAGQNRGLGTFQNIRVEPGARLPGVPAHNFNASVGWRVVPSWRVGLNVVAHSSSYVRGNENNQHQPGGSDQQVGQYYCTTGNCGITGYQQLAVPAARPFNGRGKVPGHAVLNFDTTLQIGKGLELNLLVANLFDRKYFTAGRLGVNPFAPSTIGAIGASGWNYNSAEWQNTTLVGPGAPRAFFLSLSYELDLK